MAQHGEDLGAQGARAIDPGVDQQLRGGAHVRGEATPHGMLLNRPRSFLR